MQAEISYDLVMEDEMSFVEGAYRLPGDEWQVFIFGKHKLQDPQVMKSRWDSGVTGLVFHVPRSHSLNKKIVEGMLSAALGVSDWLEVCGPDSMQLR